MNQQHEMFPVQFNREAYQYGQRSDGEIHGVVLTKPHVVNLILDLVGYRGTSILGKRLLEPSCGNGAFLVPAVERLLDVSKKTDVSLQGLKESIAAFDIEIKHVDETKARLLDILMENSFSSKDAKTLVQSWVHEGDFLLAEPNSKFDYIVGNPPYIRIEQIAVELQKEYRRRYSSLFDRADLYVGFIERSLDLLEESGRLSFICADRWVLNKYGAPLRKKITEKFSVNTYIDLHTASPFDSEVIAYPSIFSFENSKTRQTHVFKLQSANEDECKVVGAIVHGETKAFKGVSYSRFETWFAGDEPWTISSPEHLDLLRDLEARCAPIEHNGKTKIKIGVASGCDSVYITDDKQGIEADRLLPLVMRADIQNGKIKRSGKFIVNTFEDDGSIVDLDSYPGLKKYINKNLEPIKSRHVAKKNPNGWFRTIDRVYPEQVKRKKLLIPDIAGSNEVTYDSGKYYPHHNLYYVISDDWDLEVLGGLLSSKVALFFIWSYATKMRGGYLRFQAQYLRRICLPDSQKLAEELKAQIKEAFRARDFVALDMLALKAFAIKSLPDFDFVDTRK